MEEKIHNAQRMNIEAIRRIVDTVKTTLGPMGMDKMMVDGGGNVIVTNDGATILRELDSAHPAAKMIVEVSKMQEMNCHDGTTSTVVLAGQLLSNAENLFSKGLHPNVINKGYTHAAELAVKILEEKYGIKCDEEKLPAIARTAITGKTLESSEEQVAQLCVDTIQQVGNVRDVRVIAAPGGALSDSYLFNGVVVNRDFVEADDIESLGGSTILLLNGGLEEQKENTNMQVQVDAASYKTLKNADREHMLDRAKMIVKSGANLVIVRDGVHDTVVSYLRKNGILVIRRVQESIMRALSKELSSEIYSVPEDNMDCVSAFVQRKRFNDVPYIFVTCTKEEATLILFGATQSTLDEVQRGFDDALGVVSLVQNGDNICYGGGVTYLLLAGELRNQASSIGGRAQMAIEAFAESLEAIPATIAENAGHDALDTVLAMRHANKEDNCYGPNVSAGGIVSMKELNVYEPMSLIKHAIQGATEVTSAILRIDDVIGRRPVE